MAYHFSSLFANALTLHCGKYVSFTEQPLIDLCCSLFLFRGGLLDGFAFTLPSGLNNHSIHASETSPYWLSFLPSPSSLFSSYVHRPSTKTIWFWRKEISISTHSLPGRPIPMHTSPTSTPTMTINPRHLPYHQIWLFSFLCALYWDSSHHAWDKPTLRLYGSWYVIKHRHTVLPTEGNPHFLSGALRYTWKAQCFGGISCLDSYWEIDNWISWCGLNKNKRNKKTTKN